MGECQWVAMLPKRFMARLLLLGLLGTLILWGIVGLIGADMRSDITSSSDPMAMQKNGNNAQASREAVTEAKQTHHHNNQTLLNLMKNMTLLRANQTDLRNIIKRVNDSRSQTYENHTHVAHPHPFHYLLNTESVCKKIDVFLIIYVHTAPKHYKRRMVIRQTWGNQKYYPDVPIRLIFVMGKTFDKPEVQDALAFESEQYGDIVQEDFLDSYKNLTYKGVAALKWISNYCKHAKFVLKTDDDIFVNMFTLLRHLKSIDKHGMQNQNLILCLVWYRMKVMRGGKWKVSKEQFKDEFYPTYCSGSAFTLSMDSALAMHEASYHVPFFWVDDFYITGLLPLHAGLKHKQFMSTYVLNGNKLEEKFTGPQWFTYIFSHVHNLNKIQAVWDRLVQLAHGAPGPTVKFAMPGELPNEKELRRLEEEAKKAKLAKKKT